MINENKFTSPSSTLKQALKQMSKFGLKCLIVIDKNKFIGTLSDGDIRRALLSSSDMDSKIDNICNKNAYSIQKKGFDEELIKEIFLEEKFDLIPIINPDGSVERIIEWDEIFSEKSQSVSLSTPVVIMAGGMGTRMEPFTNVLPKPLIPLSERTVIEHIIDKFTNVGIDKFFISINFKGKILKAFFEELDPSYTIEFVEENEPLGTAGALHKLKNQISSTFMVTNCDVVIDLDHSDLIDFHKKNQFDITLVASTKEIVIPYGACEINTDGSLKKILEKPKLDYLINSGLYVLEPSVLEYIPKNKFFHITDLIEKVIQAEKKIGVFPIDDTAWVDIGQWEEYKNAVKRLN